MRSEGPAAEDTPRRVLTDNPDPHSDGVQALAAAVEQCERILVYSHLNPDPDTAGAALALKEVLTSYGKKVTICYRGIIGRAENRMLMRLLGGDIIHATKIDQSGYDGIFLVDCQPDYGFLPETGSLPIVGVIDHHPLSPSSGGIPYVDVRPEYGSTCTMLVEYLQRESLEPPRDVATALFYGLKTDTQDLSRRTDEPDIAAYDWLLPRIDRQVLARIENPPLPREYFECFASAVGHAKTYRNAVITEIGRMPYSDMVAEVADRLIRLDEMEWSVCFGMHGQRIYLSVRTVHLTRDAGELVKAVLRDEGVGGGHDTMAAGRVQLIEDSDETYIRIVTELWNRFLASLGEDSDIGRRLVTDDAFPERIHPSES
ncbi:MAG: recombinase RecJ [Phycisphaeraceae bacterium]|nr:recombinase RecJ [Phycisphaeraceae bacterium]